MRKLGRKRRLRNPLVPHWSVLAAGRKIPIPPRATHWAAAMPKELGMMLNDTLGDCTCAAVYHARQVWTYNATGGAHMQTEPDSNVQTLYEKACGYKPADPATDQGGICQNVLTYCMNTGIPLGGGDSVDKISAFVEIDPRQLSDVKSGIYDCGLVYIGFNVPQNIMPEDGDTPAVWTVDPSGAPIVGGHCVVLPGYDGKNGLDVISWGEKYTMTWEFFAEYVDEVYAIADSSWIELTGRTPAGVTMQELEYQMQPLGSVTQAPNAMSRW